MLLPGYDGSAEQVDLPVFNQQIVFQLLVHDPDFDPTTVRDQLGRYHAHRP
jgi:hypothetical protein